ncbi:MAG: hypothetical protein CL608_27020 [Anaerolineaceae bacterium]|nr:hypothetical protein [Anaerolineaceae bacterium]
MFNDQKLRLLVLLLALMFSWGGATLQQSMEVEALVSASEPIYIFQNFTPPAAIMDIAFESDYVWAATMNGVVRWNRHDGSYKTYTTADGLADNQVWSVAVDQAGNKWFGTRTGGVSRFNGSSWTTFKTTNGLPANFVTTISVHPNGNLYFGTAAGVVGFNGSSFFKLPAGGPVAWITAVAFDNNQNIWVGTYDVGTRKLSGSTWTSYGDSATGPGGRVRDIQVAPNGDVWFAFDSSFSGSVGRMSGSNWTRFTTANGLVNDYAQSLDFDAFGNLWAAFSDTQSGGFAKYSAGTWTQTDIRQNVGLDFTYVTKARADASGQMWYVSNNYLFTQEGTEWKVYLAGLPVPPLLGAPNMAVAPNGDIWITVVRVGVVHYDGQTWKLYTRANGLAGDEVADIFIDQAGNVWLSIWKNEFDIVPVGVNKFNGTNWTLFAPANGLAHAAVYSIAQDGSGNMWFGTFNGLSKFDGSTWTTYTTATGLLDNRIHKVAANGNDTWAVYYNNLEIAHYDGSTWTHYNASDGFTGSGVSAIDFDSVGNPWMAARTGINYFNGVSWEAFPITIDAPILYTTDMVVDVSGDVWLGAHGSITWIGLARFSKGVWSNYTIGDGLLSDGISHLAVIRQGMRFGLVVVTKV